MNKIIYRMAGVAGVLALVTQAAWATAAPVQASVSLTNLSYKLTDLSTSDAITPSLTTMPESNFWTYAIPDHLDSTDTVGTGRQGGTQFDSSSASVALSNGQGSAAKTGNAQHADTLLTMGALTSFTSLQGYSLNAESGVSTQASFKLSAHSKLVITGDLVVHSQIDAASISAIPANSDGRTLTVNSGASFAMMLTTSAGIQLTSDASKVTSDQFKTYQQWLWADTSTQSFNAAGAGALNASNNVPGGKIQLEIRNDTSGTIAFDLDSYSYVRVGTTTALPEPGTWALMGLGLLGVIAAGKQRRFEPDMACQAS